MQTLSPPGRGNCIPHPQPSPDKAVVVVWVGSDGPHKEVATSVRARKCWVISEHSHGQDVLGSTQEDIHPHTHTPTHTMEEEKEKQRKDCE